MDVSGVAHELKQWLAERKQAGLDYVTDDELDRELWRLQVAPTRKPFPSLSPEKAEAVERLKKRLRSKEVKD
ncbi:MAG: hypothetical protein NTX57_15300 [Armatimonadetes bacterium]|nr:hypothetical protein [Armatimonadota bacterium]